MGTVPFHLYNNCRIFTIPFVCRRSLWEGKWILLHRRAVHRSRFSIESVYNASVAEGYLTRRISAMCHMQVQGTATPVDIHHRRGCPLPCIRCRSVYLILTLDLTKSRKVNVQGSMQKSASLGRALCAFCDTHREGHIFLVVRRHPPFGSDCRTLPRYRGGSFHCAHS